MIDFEKEALSCLRCGAIAKEIPSAASVADDLSFHRRRRALLHVKNCLSPQQQAEWLRAGGMNRIRAL